MKISLDWLRTYIPIDTDPAELAERLTMTGLEVEALVDRFAWLEEVVVARVDAVETHPEAENLKICRVNTGAQERSIVCGAPNVAEGAKYPLAISGAVLPGGIRVERATIRGAVSEGMLCSEKELGLGPDASGLMPVNDDAAEGTPLNEALDITDPVLEIGLTPNRPDCLSFIGIAREVAALTGARLTPPALELPENRGNVGDITSVSIEAPELCPRYAARMLEGVTVAPSPFWLQDRLISVGLKPINNIVDITNFVMLETGQPLHAFDFDLLAGGRIVVRTAGADESFTTLDGKTHALSEETLMICDAQKPVAVAGVMGGENSEIGDGTSRVLIESACFDPVSVRKTAKRLGINTDASHRFERGVDPEGTVYALERAARLMAEVSGAAIISGVIDEHPVKPDPLRISLSPEKTNRHLGTNLSGEEMQRLLASVAFSVNDSGQDDLLVRVPSFRVDVSRPEDLMEEVARLWGYNRIDTTFPRSSASTRLPNRGLSLKETIKDAMCALAFNEAINYSFTARASVERMEIPAGDKRRRLLDLVNPLSEEQAVMRTSLVPGLLEAMRKNAAYQVKDLRLFELGKIFLSNGQDRLPEENEILAALWTGVRAPATWQQKAEPCDFFDLKGAVEALFKHLNVQEAEFSATDDESASHLRPGRRARIRIGETDLGFIGEVDPAVRANYDLKQAAFVFEINCHRLLPLVPEAPTFSSLPRFPAVSRDITLILDDAIPGGDILSEINALSEPLLELAEIFDLYSGPTIPEGKKSISIRLVYRSKDTTLAEEDVKLVHDRIVRYLLDTFQASLPG
jgi:phenylalanyl-tRNA synthetase beta chain